MPRNKKNPLGLVPEDVYLAQFNSILTTGNLLDLISWYNTLSSESKETMKQNEYPLHVILENLTNAYAEEQGKDNED